MLKFIAATLVLVATGCYAVADTSSDVEPVPTPVEPTTVASAAPDDVDGPVCSAAEPSLVAGICGASCAGAAALGCYAISEACIAATTVSLGALSIPCGVAMAAGCGAPLVCMLYCMAHDDGTNK